MFSMKSPTCLPILVCTVICWLAPASSGAELSGGPGGPVPADQKARKEAEEIGSLRNARVAVPMPNGRIPVTFFSEAYTPEEMADLAKIAPNVHIVAGLSRQEAVARAAEADGVEAEYATSDFLAKATKLTWIQGHGAGVEQYFRMKQITGNPAIVLTNMRGVHGPAIADHAMALLLGLTRDLPFYFGLQSAGHWAKGETTPMQPIALDGLTMFVVGPGGIGMEVARRAHGFGMHVTAVRRTKGTVPSFIERMGQPNEFLPMLAQADVVVICVPLTKETLHMFDAKAFAAMKRGSYLINVTRGKIVDTAAMMEALRDGRLAGAGMDVTDPEPLPADHPLWHFPAYVGRLRADPRPLVGGHAGEYPPIWGRRAPA
jgi:phosphoglycerate dehydrogenase-like enzyme